MRRGGKVSIVVGVETDAGTVFGQGNFPIDKVINLFLRKLLSLAVRRTSYFGH